MTKQERAAISRLRELALDWPASIFLFSQAGSLLVVKKSDFRVLGRVEIPNDGGDPGTYIKNGIEYLNLGEDK